MRAAVPLLLSLTFVIPCAGQTHATAQYEGLPGVALYNNGYLFSWDSPKNSQVTFYDRDIQPAYSVPEHKEGIYHVAWAIDSDGVAAGVYYTPVAMTAGGNVYVAIYKNDRFDGWAALDRSEQTWHKVAGYPKGRVIGSHEENLVFSTRDEGWTVLQFVPSGSLRLEKLQQEMAARVIRP